jgi:cytochrome c peroxidase
MKSLPVTIAAILLLTSANASEPLPAPATDADFRPENDLQVDLGRLLMFDKILSGNRNISCATCHHPFSGTSDGLSLPVGEGATGIGMTRGLGVKKDSVHERVPRNAPAVFNQGAFEFSVLFHDGRVSADPTFPSGCRTPAGHDLPDTLDSVLACQAMFPVTSATEMAGQGSENHIAKAAAMGDLAGEHGVWQLLAERFQSIPAYVDMFIAAFDDVASANDITYAHAANAIAAFENVAWRADNSDFDRYLRGDPGAMSGNAIQGMYLFYGGDANGNACADCHSGVFQTDHDFHAIAMPQVGAGRGSNSPGKTGGFEDFGREQTTGDPLDRLKFRTPSLRNVALTAPYGHSGSYAILEAVVLHHLDAVQALYAYDPSQAILPSRPDLDALDFVTMSDPDRVAYIAEHNELEPMLFTSEEVRRLIDFLHALTDRNSPDQQFDIPMTVPSGLPVFD